MTDSASASATPDESGSSSLPLWLGLGAVVAAGGALGMVPDGRLEAEGLG